MMLNNGIPISEDNPIPTKEVGIVQIKNSFLFDILIDDLQLDIGEEEQVVINTEGYQNIYVMAVGEGTYDLYSYPSPNASDFMEKETLQAGAAAGTGITKKPAMLAPYLKLAVKNTSGVVNKYSLWAYGV